ncbi:MAG TPA: EVE domain-containing protein, partial [Thermomicrobiaceae bacterium]|nr:EVE domain-containing protein [Thermomicrobiaceae bacterium]
MPERNYWLDLFSIETWQEFLAAGGHVSGFRANRWPTVRQIKSGDYLLCYLTRVSRWVGVLEVIGDPYQDETPIWASDPFPCRVRVRATVAVTPEAAVPIQDLREQLSIFQNLQHPHAWTGRVRGSPARWSVRDGEAILAALRVAEASPVLRPLPRSLRPSERKIMVEERHRPIIVASHADVPGPAVVCPSDVVRAASDHDEMQWMLLKLGNDQGLGVWVARNDRSRQFGGHSFAALPRLRTSLPPIFADREANQIVERIDVLWLRGNAIIAAFEIENTTTVYSGLLRMADLVALQPNLSIPLYVVAPDERQDKVRREI